MADLLMFLFTAGSGILIFRYFTLLGDNRIDWGAALVIPDFGDFADDPTSNLQFCDRPQRCYDADALV